MLSCRIKYSDWEIVRHSGASSIVPVTPALPSLVRWTLPSTNAGVARIIVIFFFSNSKELVKEAIATTPTLSGCVCLCS